MTFNRIIDRDIDAKNPRTACREIPSGKLSVGFAWIFLYVSIGLFLLASYSLNWLTFALSPVVLIVVLGYSYAKRFTVFAQLCLPLAIAPLACVDRRSRFARRRTADTSVIIGADVDRGV